MYRRSPLAALGAAAGLAGCRTPETDGPGRTDESDSSDELVTPSFEAGYRGWLVGRDPPTDPNTGAPSPRTRASRPTRPPPADGARRLHRRPTGRRHRPGSGSRPTSTAAVEDHAGWRTYESDADAAGPGVVAVGVSVVWEARVTRHLDDVRLE